MVCLEVRSKVEAISLSRRSIARRIDAIAVNIQDQLLTSIYNFQWYSIALDESTNLQDAAQLLIYIKGVNENFKITEALLTMESLKALLLFPFLVSYVGERLWWPKQSPTKEEESKRPRGERDQMNFIDLRFERWQVVGFSKVRKRQDVP